MALIRFKRGATAGIVPTGLTYGEPAVNVADQILYVGGVDGTPVPIGGGIGGAETTWSNPLPTTATNLAGVPAGTTFDAGTTAIAILEKILYPYQSVSFTSLTTGLASTYELGQTATGTPGSKTVTWKTAGPTGNWISNSGRISYSGFLGNGSLATNFELYDVGDPDPYESSQPVTYPALRATTIENNTFTVSITGQQKMDTPLVSRLSSTRWWSKMYWGKSTDDNLKNPFAMIDGITGGLSINTAGSDSRSITAGSSDGYFYLFVHDYYKLTSMTLAGFDVSLREPIGGGITTHSVANAQGFTADYKIYRSQFQLPGNLAIAIAYGPE